MVNIQEWVNKQYPKSGWTNEYGKQINRSNAYWIYLTESSLEGVLDCSDFNYHYLKIYIHPQVDENQLTFINLPTKAEVIPIDAQEYLNYHYPTKNDKEQVTKLNINDKNLQGELDLNGFINLEALDYSDNNLTSLNVSNCQKLGILWCHNNQLINLNCTNCEQLKGIWCHNNQLTSLDWFNPERLRILFIGNNNFATTDLAVFSVFVDLWELDISNNKFKGSLASLAGLSKLWRLDISNTDVNNGLEYLPENLGHFDYNTDLRPNCQLATVKDQWDQITWQDIHQSFAPKHKKDWLDAGFTKEQTQEWITVGAKPDSIKFLNWFLNFKKLDLNWAKENEEEFAELRDNYQYFGICEECQQPNTSKKWCQACNAQHFQSEFNTWTSGNAEINKFIQDCQLTATSPWNVLEWIPYEQFKNIEHLAEGGFGQVAKAQWLEGSIQRWDNKEKKWKRSKDFDLSQSKHKDCQTVVLKTLHNSQNLTNDFLNELTLYKRFKSEVSQMVPCYGVSRDPTGNYILVMQYMQQGNLREYLKKNYRELKFYSNKYGKKNRLCFLPQIIQGLKDIHRKQLVHQDFHSGNIIVDGNKCHITDLGLAQPVNEVATENKIYGLMPYVAPEVLRGQSYTQASDIYSFGIIMYELFTGCLPYADYVHDTDLALNILQGIRPKFPQKVKYPQLLIDLIKQCWDADPTKRPTAREISQIVGEWFGKYGNLKEETELYQQYQSAKTYNTCQALAQLSQQYLDQVITVAKILGIPKTERETIRQEIYSKYCQQNGYEKDSWKTAQKFKQLLFDQLHQLITPQEKVWHSKPINTQVITQLLESQNLTLELGNLSIQEDPQEQSSNQAQVELPPKK